MWRCLGCLYVVIRGCYGCVVAVVSVENADLNTVKEIVLGFWVKVEEQGDDF